MLYYRCSYQTAKIRHQSEAECCWKTASKLIQPWQIGVLQSTLSGSDSGVSFAKASGSPQRKLLTTLFPVTGATLQLFHTTMKHQITKQTSCGVRFVPACTCEGAFQCVDLRLHSKRNDFFKKNKDKFNNIYWHISLVSITHHQKSLNIIVRAITVKSLVENTASLESELLQVESVKTRTSFVMTRARPLLLSDWCFCAIGPAISICIGWYDDLSKHKRRLLNQWKVNGTFGERATSSSREDVKTFPEVRELNLLNKIIETQFTPNCWASSFHGSLLRCVCMWMVKFTYTFQKEHLTCNSLFSSSLHVSLDRSFCILLFFFFFLVLPQN